MSQGEIILYQSEDNSKFHLEVRIENDTVWLNRHQLALLFDRDIKTIGKHINNALKEELKSFSVVAKFATTGADKKIYQVEHYNLDMIISIGYRVKSNIGASLKDLGKRPVVSKVEPWFAFSKIDINAEFILERLNSNTKP
ncbi:MAG: virulence RhuM family protein [Bacteroidetes bacterium]|nr:virulence RhuM family protein [Bacteroidota bacterium]